MRFNLRKGKRYKASVVLGTFESGVANDTLKKELAKEGFSDIVMSGKGYIRYVTASWDRPDTVKQLPRQVHEIIEIKPVVQALVQPSPQAPVVPDVPLPKPKQQNNVRKGPVPWWKIW